MENAKRAYREKTKNNEEKSSTICIESNSPTKASDKDTDTQPNKLSSIEKLKRKNAVLRTQRWRMRVKLKRTKESLAAIPEKNVEETYADKTDTNILESGIEVIDNELKVMDNNTNEDTITDLEDNETDRISNEANEGNNEKNKDSCEESVENNIHDQSLKEETLIENQDGNYRKPSRVTEWRYVKKAKAALPNTPRRKSRVVEKLINSPSVKSHLEEKGLIISERARRQLKLGENVLHSVKSKLKDVTKRGTVEKEKKTAYQILHNAIFYGVKKYTIGAGLSSFLRVRRNQGKLDTDEWWKNRSRKPRKDMIDDATKEKVTLFFLSPKTSREVPNKKDVIKINDEKTNKHIMTMTMSEAFDEFKKQYPDVKIGFTSFKKFKPHQVRRVSETSHKSCLCQICCNLSLKIDAIQKFSTEKGSDNLKGTVKNWNKTNVSNITLCNYSEKEYPKAECLNRSCNECKVTNISDLLKDDVEGQMNEVITWFRWQLVSLETESGVKKSYIMRETRNIIEIFYSGNGK